VDPTANETLQDALIRHQVYLLRFSAYVRNYVFQLLDATEQDLASKIRDALRNSKGFNTPADVIRMQKLMASIEKIRGGAWTDASEWLVDQMKQLAVAEPQFAKGIMEQASPVELGMRLPPDRQLIKIVTSQPMQGAVLSDWADTMAAEDLRRIQAAVQMGMISGESSDAIARRVVGTGALDGADGVTEITRRQVQAITRTAVMTVANETRDDFFQENADVMEAEVFVATLDARTTAICRALDGKRFQPGEGPRPPLHFSCRSLRVAAFDDQVLGARPAKAATRKQALNGFIEDNDLQDMGITSRDDLPRGMKGQFDAYERKTIQQMTGQVPASTTYQEWLTRQSKGFQDEILGKTKGDLFRNGLTLDKYVAANGTELSLSQLAAKYPGAFKEAGLDPAKF
jgi:SPP1 gp7 family putative phage head morphogenesis protein